MLKYPYGIRFSLCFVKLIYSRFFCNNGVIMSEALKPDLTLDTKGTLCPIPVLKTKEAIGKISSGQILEVLATDPGADPDIRAWARRTGNEFIDSKNEGGVWRIYVKKK